MQVASVHHDREGLDLAVAGVGAEVVAAHGEAAVRLAEARLGRVGVRVRGRARGGGGGRGRVRVRVGVRVRVRVMVRVRVRVRG